MYHGSNDEEVPSLSSSNLNVKSLKKVCTFLIKLE